MPFFAVSMRIALTLVFVMIASHSAHAETYLGLEIKSEDTTVHYNRRLYKHWRDEDGNGQDARQEALIAESHIPVTFDSRGKAKEGLWVCAYTGTVVTDPSKLDVDHLIPLKEAHLSGGHSWTPAKRQEYANHLTDEDHLVAVTAGSNRSKSDRDPGEWMPPNRSYWCEYLKDWIGIKKQYGLSIDKAERDAIKEGLSLCGKYKSGDALDAREGQGQISNVSDLQHAAVTMVGLSELIP
jgi:5-methylcytosine-specific restriction endonuclease McrA